MQGHRLLRLSRLTEALIMSPDNAKQEGAVTRN